MILNASNLHMYVEECGNCMLWKLGTNSAGHPYARLDGKARQVRAYVYEHIKGRTKRKGFVISPNCRNWLCVSPEHLVMITRSQMISDSYKHGARGTPAEYRSKRRAMVNQGRTKLNMDIAENIRRFESDVPNRVLGKKYGVDRTTIADIKNMKSWLPFATSSVFEWRPK